MAAFRTLFVLLCSSAVVFGGDIPPSFDDATLHAVQFVDKTEGWVVGEQGVIWHTIDAGQTWERQKSGTRACLKQVQFLTPYTGYAFGRIELPGSLGSQGVILKTENGGLNWTELATGLLPGVNIGQFFDGQSAVVGGDATSAFPTGLFATTDGGQSWKPIDGPKGHSWQSAHFRDATSGVIVSRTGVAVIEHGRPKIAIFEHQQAAAGRLVEGSMWLARSGQIKTGNKPIKVACDVQSFAKSGNTAIAVGRPGNRTLRSVDNGTSWQAIDAPLPCTLNAVHMLNETDGWAVGELGSIVRTADGGKTWSVQKTGGQRLGVLIVCSKADRVPFDVLAMHGAKDGVLCGVVCLDSDAHPDRLAAAVRGCGGAVTICCQSNRLTEIIGQYQPDTIVTESMMTQMVEDSSGHRVKHVFTTWETTAGSTVSWDNAAMTAELASAVKDVCDLAPNLLGGQASVPANRFFTRVATSKNGLDSNSLIALDSLPRGGTARRKTLPPAWPQEYLVSMESIRVARRKIDTIVADPTKFGTPEQSLTELRNALVGLPEDVAARVSGQAAAEFARRGEWGLAREVYAFVAESFTTFTEAAEACRWLVRFHTSAEVRRRIELGHVKPLPMSIFDTVDDSVKTVSHTEAEVGTVKPVYRFKTGLTARKWSQMAIDLEPTLASFGPGVLRDPATMRGLMIARDTLGLNAPKPAEATKTIAVNRTAVKPVLDGKLDEACWGGEAATSGASTVTFAFDDRFFYVGIRVIPGLNKPLKEIDKSVSKIRERDADLSRSDRVELSLDLTRGGDTPFRFSVDEYGRLAEECWGDIKWNPKWFVAFDANRDWVAEIAIPLGELTGSPVAGKVWGVQVKEFVGGMPLQLIPPFERGELVFGK